MQGELFDITGSGNQTSQAVSPQPGWSERFRITLRLDHLSIGAILALVLYVVVFSFGMEKGKRFALDELRASQKKQETVENTHLISERDTVSVSVSPVELKRKDAAPQALPKESVLPATAAAKKYTIQLITYTSRSRAEQEVKHLKDSGYEGFIIPGGKFLQVCVDGFENMNDARKKLMGLKRAGFASPDAYIRPFKEPFPS